MPARLPARASPKGLMIGQGQGSAGACVRTRVLRWRCVCSFGRGASTLCPPGSGPWKRLTGALQKILPVPQRESLVLCQLEGRVRPRRRRLHLLKCPARLRREGPWAVRQRAAGPATSGTAVLRCRDIRSLLILPATLTSPRPAGSHHTPCPCPRQLLAPVKHRLHPTPPPTYTPHPSPPQHIHTSPPASPAASLPPGPCSLGAHAVEATELAAHRRAGAVEAQEAPGIARRLVAPGGGGTKGRGGGLGWGGV